ncbi:MAG: hypothetical protein GEU81_15555, partial [Nitriliruptorales bacterium]|nr:hypothetical protein [Nitriliruptorales bacterium]
MIAPYLEEELGADVVVQNETGAGGLLAINNLAVAEPDGLTIAIANGPGIGGSALGEAEGVQFELEELSYLARIAGEPKVWVVGSHTPWETIEDLVADPGGLRIGATGPGASTYVDAQLLLAATGIDAEIITGFEGGEEVALAITGEDVDSMVATVDSRLQLIQEGEHRALVLLGAERHEDLPEVPTILELGLEGEQETIALAHLELTEFGRPFIAPPGVPEDRLEVLRTAFENVANNPDLLEEADRLGL